MVPEITISKLDAKDKGLILKIANWYFEEWNTPIEKTIYRLTNQPNEDVLFQLVLTQRNKVVATGGVSNHVNILKYHERLSRFKPWIALLFTEKGYRNQGLGKKMLEQIEWFAKEMKLPKIYLYTFTAESLYRRNGWTEIEIVKYKGHDTIIMEKEIMV